MDNLHPEQGNSGGSPRRRGFIILAMALLSASVPLIWAFGEAAGTTTEQIKAGRLGLAQLVADQADRVVVEAFFAIELEAQRLPLDEASASVDGGRTADRNVGFGLEILLEGLVYIDTEGRPIGQASASVTDSPDLSRVFSDAADTDDRAVSPAWVAASTGHTMVALSVPVYLGDGTRGGTILGLVDLSQSLIADLSVPAARLGITGHVDLIDEQGIVVASTDPEHVLSSSHHPEFYPRAAGGQAALVETVPHLHDPDDRGRPENHLMAYAPLQNAPWGVALGAELSESIQPVSRLRYRMLVAGIASLLTLALGGFLVLTPYRKLAEHQA